MIDELMTPSDVIRRWGKKLGIRSIKTLWEHRRNGRLNFYRVGKRVLHSQRHIEEFIENHCENLPRGKSAA